MPDKELKKNGKDKKGSKEEPVEVPESVEGGFSEEKQQPAAEEAARAEMDQSQADDSGGEVEDHSADQSSDEHDEQQMLAELEKLEAEDKSTGEYGTGEELDAGNDEETMQDVQQPDFPVFEKSATTSQERNLDLLLDVNLPISIELGRTTMRIKDILSLGPGSVVELKKLAGEPVDLLVNNKVVARGEVVVVDENFGLRIVSLLSPEERLRSLEE